ncbi:S1 family peptidase [Micromonospora echinospora]
MIRRAVIAAAMTTVLTAVALAPSASSSARETVDAHLLADVTKPALAYQRPALTKSLATTTMVAPQGAATTPSPEEMEDLRRFADRRGMSLDIAVADYGWRHAFARTVGQIRTAHPAAFADAGAGPGRRAWVSFKESAPRDVHTALATLPVTVEVREHLGWNETDVVTAAQGIHYALLKDPSVAAGEVATDPDTTTGTIRVSVGPKAGVAVTEMRARVAAAVIDGTAVSSLRAVPSVLAVAIKVDPQLTSGNDTVYGGGALSGCTAAFPVRRSTNTSQHGLTTAGHCGNLQAYEGRNVLTLMTAHEGAQGDMQWHLSSEAVGNQFYYNYGVRRNAEYVGHPTIGLSVCKFGHTTGATCDEVYKVNQCRGIYCGQTMTDDRQASPGDSGGPWYWGTTGYGVHSGYKSDNFFDRDMFTPLQQVHTTLGLLLKTY